MRANERAKLVDRQRDVGSVWAPRSAHALLRATQPVIRRRTQKFCDKKWHERNKLDRQRRPCRVLATPELKVNDGNRTELKTNSFSGRYNRIATRNISNICAHFPSDRLLVTPEFRIRLAPPASLGFAVFSREVSKIRTCTHRPARSIRRIRRKLSGGDFDEGVVAGRDSNSRSRSDSGSDGVLGRNSTPRASADYYLSGPRHLTLQATKRSISDRKCQQTGSGTTPRCANCEDAAVKLSSNVSNRIGRVLSAAMADAIKLSTCGLNPGVAVAFQPPVPKKRLSGCKNGRT